MNACPPKFAPRTRPALSRVTARVERVAPDGAAGETLSLRDGELWAVDPVGGPLQVRCLAGDVWITQEGRGDDVVLTAGGMCVVPGHGKVVVQALDDAIVHIDH